MSTGRWRKGRKSKAYYKRKYDLKSRYNMSLEDYDNLLKKQNNHCALCPATYETFNERLHVDHNHNTNVVRGLLCRRCNVLIEVTYTTHPKYNDIQKYLES